MSKHRFLEFATNFKDLVQWSKSDFGLAMVWVLDLFQAGFMLRSHRLTQWSVAGLWTKNYPAFIVRKLISMQLQTSYLIICLLNTVNTTELKDDRIEKYGSLFVFISKKHCHATLKNLLADGRGGWVADGRLCKSRVAAKFLFLYFREICMKFLILCYAKFPSNFAKLKIKNVVKILRNYENENFAATLCTIGCIS